MLDKGARVLQTGGKGMSFYLLFQEPIEIRIAILHVEVF